MGRGGGRRGRTRRAGRAERNALFVRHPGATARAALKQIGQIAGLAIDVDPAHVSGLKAGAVHGELTARQAVAAALEGTGVRHRFKSARTVIIEPPRATALNANAQATALPTIDVLAAPAETRVIGYIATRTSTATKTDTPLINVPQSVTVITRQQVDDIGAQRLEDVVRYVPGVNWHQGENNRDQIVIRGQSSTADFFVNGMRDDGQVYRDLYNASASNSSRAERDDLRPGRRRRRAQPRAQGSGRRSDQRMEAAGRLRQQQARLGRRRRQDQRAMGRPHQRRVRGHQQLPRLLPYAARGREPDADLDPTAATKIKLSYEYFRDFRTADRGIPSQNGLPYFPAAPSTFFGNPALSFTPSTQNIVMADIEHQFDNGLKVKSQTRFADYKRFYQNVYPGSAVSTATDTLTLSAYNNSNDRQNIDNQTDWTFKLMTGPVKHTVLFGTEFANQKSANARFSGFFTNGTTTSNPIPASNPVSFGPVSFTGLATDARNKTNLNIAAAYTQDQIELTQWLLIIGGLRFDRFDLNYLNLNARTERRSVRHSVASTICSRRASARCSSRLSNCRSMRATASRTCRPRAISSTP